MVMIKLTEVMVNIMGYINVLTSKLRTSGIVYKEHTTYQLIFVNIIGPLCWSEHNLHVNHFQPNKRKWICHTDMTSVTKVVHYLLL